MYHVLYMGPLCFSVSVSDYFRNRNPLITPCRGYKKYYITRIIDILYYYDIL